MEYFHSYCLVEVGISLYSIRLKWIDHFAVGILLLHHYKSDLADLSDLYILVVVMYKYEI